MTLAPRLQAPSCLALVSGPLVIPHAQQVMCIIASSSPGNHCDFTKTGQCLSSRTPGPCPPPPAPHSIWRLWPRAGDKNLPALPGLFPPALAFRTHCMNQEILMEHWAHPRVRAPPILPFCRWLLSQVNPMLCWGWSWPCPCHADGPQGCDLALANWVNKGPFQERQLPHVEESGDLRTPASCQPCPSHLVILLLLSINSSSDYTDTLAGLSQGSRIHRCPRAGGKVVASL